MAAGRTSCGAQWCSFSLLLKVLLWPAGDKRYCPPRSVVFDTWHGCVLQLFYYCWNTHTYCILIRNFGAITWIELSCYIRDLMRCNSLLVRNSQHYPDISQALYAVMTWWSYHSDWSNITGAGQDNGSHWFTSCLINGRINEKLLLHSSWRELARPHSFKLEVDPDKILF